MTAPPPEPEFWRLFASYEDLTQHQHTAIREGNFVLVETLHATKTAILNAMAQINASAGRISDHPSLQVRLEALKAMVQRNIELTNEKLQETQRTARRLESASKRLKAVEHVYHNGTKAETLRIHG